MNHLIQFIKAGPRPYKTQLKSPVRLDNGIDNHVANKPWAGSVGMIPLMK